MKKVLFFLLLILLSNRINANTLSIGGVDLNVCSLDNPYNHSKPRERGRIFKPYFYIDGNSLFFEETESPFMLYLYKGDEIIFSEMVPSGESQIYLPYSLDGKYCIMVVYGDIAFSGNIVLG